MILRNRDGHWIGKVSGLGTDICSINMESDILKAEDFTEEQAKFLERIEREKYDWFIARPVLFRKGAR